MRLANAIIISDMTGATCTASALAGTPRAEIESAVFLNLHADYVIAGEPMADGERQRWSLRRKPR